MPIYNWVFLRIYEFLKFKKWLPKNLKDFKIQYHYNTQKTTNHIGKPLAALCMVYVYIHVNIKKRDEIGVAVQSWL